MSLSPANKPPSKAEGRFREAFARLQAGKTETLPIGAPVTQNNVAREAGLDPSALRRSRYPELVEEIQACVKQRESDVETKSIRQRTNEQRGRKYSLAETLKNRTNERDEALSKLLDAQRYILELLTQIRELTGDTPETHSVIQLRSPRKKRY
jgi:hypothetical protein